MDIKQLADAIYRDRVLRARATPPAQKLLAGAQLFDYACRISMDGIRNQYPNATEEAVREHLARRVALGRRLEQQR